MEPAANEFKISEEKRLDPFETALIEDLQDLVFQHLTGKEVKKIYEVSPLWNEIASASKKCGDKLKLIIDDEGDSIRDKLQIISKNGRKYGSLWLGSTAFHDTPNTILLQEIVAGLGSSLKKLKITGSIKTSDVAILLKTLHNLEDLQLSQIVDDDECVDLSPLLLPKLRKLTLENSGNSWMNLFSNVSTLEEFDDHYKASTNFHDFENFILRQEKLKKLAIYSDHSSWNEHSIFSDLSLVKFRLESITIDGLRISTENVVKFFQQQQENLKKVGIGNFISDGDYTEVLRSIWTLPNLESFEYRNSITNTNFVALGNIRNESVKQIQSMEGLGAEIDRRLFRIFPNLQTYRTNSDFLKLKNVPSEKLAMLEISEKTEVLIYVPPMFYFVQEEFESDVIEFLRRSDQIQYLFIGRDGWIEREIQLSTDFWKNAINVSLKLKRIVIFHSVDIKQLVQDLIGSQRKFNSVTILTNNIGRASVEGMKMPSWLDIINTERR
jgi:hypothetical protein